MDASHPTAAPQPGWRIRRLAMTPSTNTVALDAAAAGEPEGLVVVAAHQTAGRGRLGRTWSAPPGSALLVSVLLRPPPSVVHLAVTAVGCAAAAGCARVSGYEPGLKWPNDLVADDRKLGGILAETSGNVAAVVVGLGLNVRPVADRPEPLRAVAVDLEDLARTPVDQDGLLAAILEELATRYQQLKTDGPDELLAEYRRRCVTIGREVRVEQPDKTLTGVAVDIARDGSLTLEERWGGRVRVDVGDVVHVRPA